MAAWSWRAGRRGEVMRSPAHPYARAQGRAAEIGMQHDPIAISGRPPDLVVPPPGCRFAPRCPFRLAICDTEMPRLTVPSTEPRGSLPSMAGDGRTGAARANLPRSGAPSPNRRENATGRRAGRSDPRSTGRPSGARTLNASAAGRRDACQMGDAQACKDIAEPRSVGMRQHGPCPAGCRNPAGRRSGEVRATTRWKAGSKRSPGTA